MLKELLVVFVCLATSRAQVALNPPVPVTAQCYYHTFIGGGVNHCTQGLVPNCAKAAVPGFSYEACDCNLTLSHGIDVIFVLDQLPYTVTEGPTESQKLWEDYLDVLEVAIEPILRRSSDNTIGVIRPTTTGCDTFGSSVLKQGNLVSNFSGTFPYKDYGACGASACPPNVVLSGTCTQTARSILLARSRFRRKIIVSMRHSPGNGGFAYTNEPANNLQYFVITTRPRPSYRVPGTFMSEFDYGGIDKPNNLFVLTTTNIRLINWMLNPANTANPGFILCDTIWPFLRRDVLPAQQAATLGMTCTYFPNGPSLTWMTTLTTGQNVVRRTIPALTSWLCQFTPPTSAPTLSPTSNPTSCRGPPPIFPPASSPVCSVQCAGQLIVDPRPIVAKPTPTTTQMCWTYGIGAGSNPTCARATSVKRVSFAMDECCPDGAMNFIDEIGFGGPFNGVSRYSRAQCPMITSGVLNDAFSSSCTRYQRTCSNGRGNIPSNKCTVYNINNMASGDRSGQFCLLLAGTQNYDVAPPDGRLDSNKVEMAQLCIERDDPLSPTSEFCSCVAVQFVRSRERCEHTSNPTRSPTDNPTTTPTSNPTKSPSKQPTKSPTTIPTVSPSKNPTKNPSNNPTKSPSKNPSKNPTKSPTENPTKNPSVSPTRFPTKSPSKNPTTSPTRSPTKNPSTSPTKNPSVSPTTSPSLPPTSCTGPPPDYVRPDCRTKLCNNPVNEEIVRVIPQPRLTQLSDRTRLCWNYQMTNFGGVQCGTSGTPIRGVSFIMDECCPDGLMEFIEEIQMADGNTNTIVVSQTRATCPIVGPASNPGAHNPNCSRATRVCTSSTGSTGLAQCTVVNLNNLNVGASVGTYCLTIPGVNWKNPFNNQMKNSVKQFAKLCFERGQANPFSNFNVCSCFTIEFVNSKLICDDTGSPTKDPTRTPSKMPTKMPTTSPTKNPSKNPTKTPSANPTTSSPTQCQGPPPQFHRKNARHVACNNANGNVDITMVPTVTVDNQTSTTKLCYDITVKATPGSAACAIADKTIRGVSFLLDECCPVPMMDFLEEVSFGTSATYSVRNGQCPIVMDPFGGNSGCFRGQRSCAAPTSQGGNCSVVNLNGLAFTGSGPVKYCVTLPGVKFTTVNPARIDLANRETGKICVENGMATGTNNIVSCVDVEIVKSHILCQATRNPSMSPTKGPSTSPVVSPTGAPTLSGKCFKELPPKPEDKTCKYPCADNQMAEWDPYLDSYEYKPDYDVTIFKYCVDMDYNWYKQHYACIARGKTRASDIAHVTFRLDQCCELCLDKDHFYEVKPNGVKKMMIMNGDDMKAPSFKIDPDEEHEAKCYTLKLNGEVGLQPGWMCVKGGYKCDCTQVDVPYTCDLKKWADPKCESSSSSSEGRVWWGGRTSSKKKQSGRGRGGGYGGYDDDDDQSGSGYGGYGGYGRGGQKKSYGGGRSRSGRHYGGGWRR